MVLSLADLLEAAREAMIRAEIERQLAEQGIELPEVDLKPTPPEERPD